MRNFVNNLGIRINGMKLLKKMNNDLKNVLSDFLWLEMY
ncbi:hypothetical protein NBRC111894_992 [Sporolactobacillus inulinus]|uniref:Uncharacterized protein n=1 Tax=Sporolactobacillus inulinus TaxID=2078 RepID=A0A4Y1Z9A5_9BACL|nr:hypothetical protein NBRC111894_992 [Sporolactobacillus inulinus]